MKTKQNNSVWIELEISDNDEVNHQRARLLTDWLFTQEEQKGGLKVVFSPASKKRRAYYIGYYNRLQSSQWADNGHWFSLDDLAGDNRLTNGATTDNFLGE